MPLLQVVPTKCEKCGGVGFWDNRADKKNPKAPDFKCKNKACGDGIWLKKGHVWADADDDVQVVTTFKGPATPTKTVATATAVPAPQHVSIAEDCAEYVKIAWTLALSLDKAIAEAREAGEANAAEMLSMLGNDLQAATATVSIGRQRRGGR